MARRSPAIESYTSALTLPLIYFFRRRVADEATARADAQAILKGVQLVPLTQALLDSAAAAAGADFEDNVQLISAESLSVTHRVTRNKKDFTNTPLTVVNPENGSPSKRSPN